MLRSFCALFAIAFVLQFSANGVIAQNQTAYDLLPQETQAVVYIPDGSQLVDAWNRTQFAQLTSDEKVAPFFDEKRQEIKKRFMDAGWRLNVQPGDLEEFSEGQIAIAWANQEDTPVRPYSMTLIADVSEDADVNQKMIDQIEEQLKDQQAETTEQKYGDVTITRYSLPPRNGEFLKQESFLAIVKSKLLVTDNAKVLQELINRLNKRSTTPALSSEQDFVKSRSLAELSGEGQIEYFVRPLGFARVIRAIGGTRSNSDTDLIAALEKQGFAAISCVCGELTIGGPELDVRHHGYVYAKTPLEKSANLLDFPNQVSTEVPNFIGDNVATLLALNWNANKAFWAAEGLVDEIAGAPNVFKEVIDGIRVDPNGPQVDIRAVLPNLTNDIFSVSDSQQGDATVNSRRNMIAIALHDGPEMAEILDQVMKNEPDARRLEFQSHVIWQVSHPEESDIDLVGSEFGDFGAPTPAESDESEPWLSNWAITVHDNYLIFSSHVEMIEEAIMLAGQAADSPLIHTEDYQRVSAAIQRYFGQQANCGWRILRAEKAYRVQYELFRKGELKRSESMLASILDRLVQSESDIPDTEQKISGEGLPDFEEIAKYLQPSGFLVHTTEDGWEFDGILLGVGFDAEIVNTAEFGTARVGTADPETQR